MKSHACRQAQPADVRSVTATLAEAFQDEPAFSFIEPDVVARKAVLAKAFRIIVPEDLRAGRVMLTPEGEAATLWRTPVP